MVALPATAPVLSTPDAHILTESSPALKSIRKGRLSETQLETRYEILRTITVIKEQKWSRVALQFPDEMLLDSARVYELLAHGLRPESRRSEMKIPPNETKETDVIDQLFKGTESTAVAYQEPVKFIILADTSYGSCCVDEVAAEHVNANAVIHYGRACLSPTARLPVLHIFTQHNLDHTSVVKAFTNTFKDHAAKIILTADIAYVNHIEPLGAVLVKLGYSNLFPSAIQHDPSSPIPNRTVPDAVVTDPAELQKYQLFHISDPPTALLLTLSSRVNSIHIYPTDSASASPLSTSPASTTSLLRRRYALVTSLSTVSTWGILINTLSVKNYLDIVEHVKQQISDAGKKSYLFVVGKLNAAKVANFSEISGWVVIGCWESSLIDSADFYKPVLTPFELALSLQSDSKRLWTGQWRSDFQAILDIGYAESEQTVAGGNPEDGDEGDYNSGEESAPPEFDLRTGRYVSQSKPLAANRRSRKPGPCSETKALTRRTNGDMVAVNGLASPAAEYLQSKRTWQGLGSDFEVRYDEGEDKEQQGGLLEEGRSGIAQGYTVAESKKT